MWLEAAKRVFEGIDGHASGRLSGERLVALLRRKLPAEEVESAVEAAMLDAGYAGGCRGWGLGPGVVIIAARMQHSSACGWRAHVS